VSASFKNQRHENSLKHSALATDEEMIDKTDTWPATPAAEFSTLAAVNFEASLATLQVTSSTRRPTLLTRVVA